MSKIINDDADNGSQQYKTLIIHGEKYKTLYTKKFEERKAWIKPDAKRVVSFLPGTVLEIYPGSGDIVEKDEIMMVLEAMKMQNTYYYPLSGTIKSVHVKKGDRIPKGFLILEFE